VNLCFIFALLWLHFPRFFVCVYRMLYLW
jgi:hypothetical protein